MNDEYLQFMKEMSQKYLCKQITQKDLINAIDNKIYIVDILNSESQILIDFYFSIKHLEEEGWFTRDEEIEEYINKVNQLGQKKENVS